MELSLRKMIGQCFFVGISGTTLTDDEKKFLLENNIGGVILFARNCQSPEQVHALTTEIQSLHSKMPSKAPFFIGVDMEGGRVARLKPPFTKWPPLHKLGVLDSTSIAFKFAESMGQELRAVGINTNFAPCVDVLTNPENKVIGDRSIGSDPELVAKIGSAVVRGYLKSDIMACAKHFPGHGNTLIDSHEDLPVENATLEELSAVQFSVFKKVFRARLDLLMTAHIRFPNLDPIWPATLSRTILNDILRGELGYRNIIVTDDLDMKALRNNYSIEKIAAQAFHAGANILLYCNEPESPPRALAAVEKAIQDKELKLISIESSYSRIIELKKQQLANPNPLPLPVMAKLIGHPQHVALSQSIEAGQIPEELKT
jgi:beta-N-acetylhexosaminidase